MKRESEFVRVGQVTKVVRLAGSFIQARVRNAESTRVHTLGLDDAGSWPTVGSHIRVKGVIRNGQYLTSKWEFV